MEADRPPDLADHIDGGAVIIRIDATGVNGGKVRHQIIGGPGEERVVMFVGELRHFLIRETVSPTERPLRFDQVMWPDPDNKGLVIPTMTLTSTTWQLPRARP